MTLDDFDILSEHRNIEHIRSVREDYKHTRSEIPSKATHMNEARQYHLMFVSLKGPWFFINGEKYLGFKTRGNNEQDLRQALIKYDIEFWESDLEQIARDMAVQLRLQAEAKNTPVILEPIPL